MKGIIPAVGSGTRLGPITKIINKGLLLAYKRPVIFYVIDTFVKSGIYDVTIVVRSSEKSQFESILNDYKQLGLKKLRIVTSDHTLGMPYSILQAKKWTGTDPFMVIPCDNIFLQSFEKEVSTFMDGAIVFKRRVPDPTRFGVPVYKDKRLVDLVEKPKIVHTPDALIAPYIFDSKAYSYIETLKPSNRGELEITGLLKMYLREEKLTLVRKTGFWKDIGTPEALLEVGNYLKKLGS